MERTPESTPRSKQQERTERILDAAAEQLLRWGYKRVTIDDIARQTSIGTGTIYLHWKTKETLFESVMLREIVAVWRELMQRIRSDPAEVLISNVMRSMLLIIHQRPLARALFTRDANLLGKLAQGNLMLQTRQTTPSKEFLSQLRQMGLLRADMSLPAQTYAFTATVTGFTLVDPFLELEQEGSAELSLDEKAEAMARIIHDAFEPETLPSHAILQAEVVPTIVQLLEQVCVYCEQQMQERIIS